MSRLVKILILGSFDDSINIGDTAILSALVSDFQEELSEVEFTVPVRRRNALKPYPVRTIWSRILLFDPHTIASVFKTDLLLVTQGNIFDTRLYDVTFNRLFGYAYLFVLAKLLNKKIAFYNAGLGPITTNLGERVARFVVREADIISLREIQSVEYLKKWQIKVPYSVAADPALNTPMVVNNSIRDTVLENEGIDVTRTNIAFNVTRYIEQTIAKEPGIPTSRFTGIIVDVVTQLRVEFDASIFFIVTCADDLKISQKIMTAVQHLSDIRLIVPMLKYTPSEFVAILSAMDIVIGSRMHCLILSVTAGTPVIGIAYSPKTRNFLTNIGQSNRVLEINELNTGKLTSLIKEIMSNRTEIVSSITDALIPLKEKARESAKLTVDLIR